MGFTLDSYGKPAFSDPFNLPGDLQAGADFTDLYANVRSGTAAGRSELLPAQRRVGMIWVETDTGIPYMDTVTGWVALGAKFIGIKARRVAPQSCAHGVFTTLSWDTETFDVGGFRSAGAPTDLVAPVTGVYQVNASGGFPVAMSGRVGLQFLKNGTVEHGGNLVPVASQGDISAGASTLVRMNAGDVLRVQIYQESGGALNTSTSGYTMPTVTVQLMGGI